MIISSEKTGKYLSWLSKLSQTNLSICKYLNFSDRNQCHLYRNCRRTVIWGCPLSSLLTADVYQNIRENIVNHYHVKRGVRYTFEPNWRKTQYIGFNRRSNPKYETMKIETLKSHWLQIVYVYYFYHLSNSICKWKYLRL